MKALLFSTLVLLTGVLSGVLSSVTQAAGPVPLERVLTASDGTTIRLTYTQQYREDHSYKPTNVYTAEDVQIFVSRQGLNANTKISVVLMNYNRYDSVPLTYEMRDIAAVGYRGETFAPYFWAQLKDAKITKSYMSFPYYQPLTLREEGYGGVFAYRQELSVVIDGEWLVDPVNGTHNFKLEMF